MTHGQNMDNLIMGLFNLNFAMSDFEEALMHCNVGSLSNIVGWQEIREGISHESIVQI